MRKVTRSSARKEFCSPSLVSSLQIAGAALATTNAMLLTTSPYFPPQRTVLPRKVKSSCESRLFLSNKKIKTEISPVINEIKSKIKTERTNSFGALVGTESQPIHTLILGTHPSVASLARNKYFGHSMNAFWWIAGDCLGFRRESGIGSKGEPYKFSANLRYGNNRIISYEEQVELLTSQGFAVWDIIQSCERKGSLDSNIKKEEANDLQGFFNSNPSLKRIVLANGKSGCDFFKKHFKDWWEEKDILFPFNEASKKAFGKKYGQRINGKIQVICALAVSPAAATYSYVEKRDFWEEFVYRPGLEDRKAFLNSKLKNSL